MVPIAAPSRRVGIALLAILLVFLAVAQPSINDLPGFSDHTGPTELEITEFEQVAAGCVDEVATKSRSSSNGATYTRTQFIGTPSADADLSVWVERTSQRGADLSTFRVHVESHDDDVPPNKSCDTGVLYHLSLEGSGGSPPGLLPDAHGTRIIWYENGEFAGCSAWITSPLDSECHRFYGQRLDRTWANASSDITGAT